jgi:hypothetical protein
MTDQGLAARSGAAAAESAELVEIGVDKNTTVVFPAPLMRTIEELGAAGPGAGSAKPGRTRLLPSAEAVW